MKNKGEDSNVKGTRLELKYCEHCGALWLREPGSDVYCANCRPQIAELPVVQKPPKRVTLPVRGFSVFDNDFEFAIDDEDSMDFEAAGGAA